MSAKKLALFFLIAFISSSLIINPDRAFSLHRNPDKSEIDSFNVDTNFDIKSSTSRNAVPTCCDNCNDCDKYMAFKIGSRDWKICDQNQPQMSTAPVVQKGRTFLVVKYIADSIEALVYWDPSKQLVRIFNPQTGLTIDLVIGSNKVIINNKEVQIDVNPDIKPFISGGRTLLPLRFISDSLGLQVSWAEKTKEAVIYFKNPECAPGIDFELKDTDDVMHKLSDYRGKPMLIDFSVSTCIYCIKAMPILVNLYKKYKDRVIFFTVDPGEDLFFVQMFKNEMGATWPFLTDFDKWVSNSLNVSSYPRIFILNEQGQIKFIQPGYNSSIESILGDQLERLLKK